jgi:uncharacterized protein YggE
VSITIRDLDKVGVLINEGVTLTKASVRNLSFRVDRENPAHTRLMAAAARDAKARAFAYTDALGMRLGEVELISESAISAGPEPMPRFAMAVQADGLEMSSAPPMAVSGGLIELTASVHVRFSVLS